MSTSLAAAEAVPALEAVGISKHFDGVFALNGAHLSVEIEVGGVRYGPSTIARRGYSPEWDYEFSRPVRWKSGIRPIGSGRWRRTRW